MFIGKVGTLQVGGMLVSLNPYSNGICLLALMKRINNGDYECLNPYSNGICLLAKFRD